MPFECSFQVVRSLDYFDLVLSNRFLFTEIPSYNLRTFGVDRFYDLKYSGFHFGKCTLTVEVFWCFQGFYVFRGYRKETLVCNWLFSFVPTNIFYWRYLQKQVLRLWRRYFFVNFAKFLRTLFLNNTSERLLP